MPNTSTLIVDLYTFISRTKVIRHEKIFPLLMRTENPSFFNSYTLFISAQHFIIDRLQFIPFILPQKLYLLLAKLIFSKKSDNPQKHLSLIRIIQIVIIRIQICVIVDIQIHILNLGNCTYLLSRFVEKNLSDILYHPLPIYVIKSSTNLGQYIRIILLPNGTQSQSSPKHLTIIQRRNSIYEIGSRRWQRSIHIDPRQKSSITWILLIEFLQSIHFLLDYPKHVPDFIHQVCVWTILQYFSQNSQMNRLFTAGREAMQSLRQQLSSLNINSNTIQSQTCVLINPNSFYEFGLISRKISEKLLNKFRITQKLTSIVLSCESAQIRLAQ